MSTTTSARKLVLSQKAPNAESIAPAIVPLAPDEAPEGHAVILVQAAAVNPSDAKAALGMMPHAIWPRTPGRDFAGVVVAGPDEWRGVEVFGTGGDLGMTRDGAHATHLVLPIGALARKPATMGITGAATIGVPFITAYEGLRRAGLKGQGQTVLVLGVNGKVGQAATQLATRAGARVIGVGRGENGYIGHATGNVQAFRAGDPELARKIMAATDGRGVDIAYNTIGSPYFGFALETLAVGGTQILISTIDRSVPFDILAFYRRNLQMLGVDSLKLTAVQCAAILNELLPGFENESLKAFEVDASSLFALEQASDAYRKVLAGSTERVILLP